MPRDEPIPLRDALSRLGRDLGLPANDAFAVVAATWTELAGPALGAHSRVRALRNGACTIEVDEPVWATRARYLTSDLERVVNGHAEGPLVTTVHVVVSRPGRTV